MPPLIPIRELNRNLVKPLRAGAIIYTLTAGPEPELLFCFGLDSKYETFTDFGGGISYSKDGDVVSGGLRELQEESLGLFSIPKEQVAEQLCVYDRYLLIMLLPLSLTAMKDKTQQDCIAAFNERLKTAENPEVKGLVWMTELELARKLRMGEEIYQQPRNLLKKVKKQLFPRLRGMAIDSMMGPLPPRMPGSPLMAIPMSSRGRYNRRGSRNLSQKNWSQDSLPRKTPKKAERAPSELSSSAPSSSAPFNRSSSTPFSSTPFSSTPFSSTPFNYWSPLTGANPPQSAPQTPPNSVNNSPGITAFRAPPGFPREPLYSRPEQIWSIPTDLVLHLKKYQSY